MATARTIGRLTLLITLPPSLSSLAQWRRELTSSCRPDDSSSQYPVDDLVSRPRSPPGDEAKVAATAVEILLSRGQAISESSLIGHRPPVALSARPRLVRSMHRSLGTMRRSATQPGSYRRHHSFADDLDKPGVHRTAHHPRQEGRTVLAMPLLGAWRAINVKVGAATWPTTVEQPPSAAHLYNTAIR